MLLSIGNRLITIAISNNYTSVLKHGIRIQLCFHFQEAEYVVPMTNMIIYNIHYQNFSQNINKIYD